MSLILTILGIVVATTILALLFLAALSGLGVIVAGRGIEWIFDRLVPARRTGLGPEGLIGRSAEVVAEFEFRAPGRSPEGTVRVSGELWKARLEGSECPVRKQLVRIVELDGLVAVVVPRE
jgi:membrane protein implicated in regulation of membrane protease activity